MHNLKIPIIRNKNHLRFISQLPCAICRIGGYSQAAHIGRLGLGIKSPDSMVLPLCCQRPNTEGCHAKQHRLGEQKFYEDRGGIGKAKQLATDLWNNTGNWDRACYYIARF